MRNGRKRWYDTHKRWILKKEKMRETNHNFHHHPLIPLFIITSIHDVFRFFNSGDGR
jgi:hypothetical protein